jgi:hypothetical protein
MDKTELHAKSYCNGCGACGVKRHVDSDADCTTYKLWLRSLKVGDEVGMMLLQAGEHYGNPRIWSVFGVSPNHILVGNVMLRLSFSNVTGMPLHAAQFCNAMLIPVTQNIKDHLDLENKRNMLSSLIWDQIDGQKVRAIHQIVFGDK